ncbi:hypothetical protein B0H13DRAFT_2280029 [Mycena leptocephala]|nr:hypothetical protein B0H13DRAFT_2280029 [Mycena leptocephala]
MAMDDVTNPMHRVGVVPPPPDNDLLALLQRPRHKDAKIQWQAHDMNEPLWRARMRVPVRRRTEVLARWRDGAGVAREEGARRGGRGGVERIGWREDGGRTAYAAVEEVEVKGKEDGAHVEERRVRRVWGASTRDR